MVIERQAPGRAKKDVADLARPITRPARAYKQRAAQRRQLSGGVDSNAP